jgi:hypothetical protein
LFKRKVLELRTKALYFVQPRGETFGIFGSAAQEILEVRPKALHFIQPRRERFWICNQKHCVLFSRAGKIVEL